MTPLAPFISHGIGLLIAYLVTRWQLTGVDADAQRNAVSFLSLIFEGVVIWIGVHLGISWKINPFNAVKGSAVQAGKSISRKQATTNTIEQRIAKAGAERRAEVPYPTPADTPDEPPQLPPPHNHD